jgi:hypothetical protein
LGNPTERGPLGLIAYGVALPAGCTSEVGDDRVVFACQQCAARGELMTGSYNQVVRTGSRRIDRLRILILIVANYQVAEPAAVNRGARAAAYMDIRSGKYDIRPAESVNRIVGERYVLAQFDRMLRGLTA